MMSDDTLLFQRISSSTVAIVGTNNISHTTDGQSVCQLRLWYCTQCFYLFSRSISKGRDNYELG